MINVATWQLINQSLSDHKAVLLLYVLESQGSSPGRQGFFMAVNESGQMEGSIGGGIMEYKFVEMAKERLTHAGTSIRTEIKKQFHYKKVTKDQSGMICSGEQTILLHVMQHREQKVIKQIISSLTKNKTGTLILSPFGIQFENKEAESNFFYTFQSKEDWLYREKTGYKNQLFIIGGGHCALALSLLMCNLDFYIRIYDDRKGLKTMTENTVAHEKHFVSDYSELKNLIVAGENHFVIIMTMGYRTDDIVYRALYQKKFSYLGMLGSKTKIQTMFKQYRKEKIINDETAQIHAPAGISISSRTPEEIAVSIAAEIIKSKNKMKNKK